MSSKVIAPDEARVAAVYVAASPVHALSLIEVLAWQFGQTGLHRRPTIPLERCRVIQPA